MAASCPCLIARPKAPNMIVGMVLPTAMLLLTHWGICKRRQSTRSWQQHIQQYTASLALRGPTYRPRYGDVCSIILYDGTAMSMLAVPESSQLGLCMFLNI